ncbi:MAG: alpha/beta hydrolase [Beijerinckiaceae bacterium]|nr:alpha/beta hydrolase [Beijerinckiaceae bacterium]
MTNSYVSRPSGRRASRHTGSPSWVRPTIIGSLLVGATLALAAGVNNVLAREAEHAHPPKGRFIEVDGVQLHYVERGSGAPVVLIHGNGASSDEFLSSGLVDILAKNYRVIVFDRPGYGFSERPRGTIWTAERQAELIYHALVKLNAQPATIFGHSWGTLVALALAERWPHGVSALTLASGYFFPSARMDVVVMSPPALPVVGTLSAATMAPLISRMMWRSLVRKIFAPAPVPAKFHRYPKELAIRPSQLQASAGDSALMIPAASKLQHAYQNLTMPVSIIAGGGDRVANIDKQSARLHALLRDSHFVKLPGVGHMVHQTEPHAVAAAIDWAAQQAESAMSPKMTAGFDTPTREGTGTAQGRVVS